MSQILLKVENRKIKWLHHGIMTPFIRPKNVFGIISQNKISAVFNETLWFSLKYRVPVNHSQWDEEWILTKQLGWILILRFQVSWATSQYSFPRRTGYAFNRFSYYHISGITHPRMFHRIAYTVLKPWKHITNQPWNVRCVFTSNLYIHIQ